MAGVMDVVTAVVAECRLLCLVLYHWAVAVVRPFIPTSLIAKDVSGQTVLITGAGSGIGRLLALEFAALKCRLALWDISAEGNAETAQMCKQTGAVVKTYIVDVSDRKEVYKAADKVTSELGDVDILVNNAGIVTGRRFLDCPDHLIERTMNVNALAHFWTMKAFLPAMIARDHGHVVSIASSAGLLGAPGLADYCSSKFAAVGLEDALRLELETMGKRGVHSTVVCPFLINTGMFEGCRVKFPWLLNILEPEEVSKRVVQAVLRNEHQVVIPRMLYPLFALKGILPHKCMAALYHYMGGWQLMETFKGRSTIPN